MREDGHLLNEAMDDSHDDDSRPGKRQRNFIARQACEACRAKKTRCDEDLPCSLCKTLGIECTYAERKPTKNETSMSMIFNTLRRMESKLDQLSSPVDRSSVPDDSSRRDSRHVPAESPYQAESEASNRSLTSPRFPETRIKAQPSQTRSVLSFSAHQTIHWPGVQASLPPTLMTAFSSIETSYPTLLESGRPPLDTTIMAQAATPTADWLVELSLSSVKELSNAYFDTFNRVYPFIDRDFYFLSTLSLVFTDGFGYDIESCLVLNVLALGCMALKAFEEGGFDAFDSATLGPLINGIVNEDIAGLSFFNEARKRVGFCLCDQELQSCQYYLTSALFYAQTMRPMDEWMMTTRAAVNCAAFWKCPPQPIDDWLADMQSRLFWSALILETVIVQEFELPSSRLKEWEDVVPLPKFTVCPYLHKTRPKNPDDSFYHYHFLAQIAHRIILSRVRDELYYNNPSTALADELSHQLEQWRANLPKSLQFPDNAPDVVFDSPADAVVVALLQARYRISIYHLGRPFLYKATQNSASLTPSDLKMCSKALQFAMDWPLLWDVCGKMKNFMPLKYFVCGQFFGQLFIFHAFRQSPDKRLQEALPVGFDVWCTKMLRYISNFVVSSPTAAKDFDLLAKVYNLAET